jgi:Protein of unknown function (DUF1552)
MSPIRPPMSRRALLRGAGGVAIALPFLDAMLPRRAQAATTPKRLFSFFNENGVVGSAWFPTGTEKDFQLNVIHKPLEPWKSNLILFDGMDQLARGGTAHMRGKCACLTGQPNNGGRAAGISIDQAVANQIATGTRVKSVESSVAVNGNFRDGVFHSGPGQFIPPEDDPAKVFARLFSAGVPAAAGSADAATANKDFARLRTQRKSILDLALVEYQRVAATVGSGDRMRLERHMSVIRQIESGLDAGPSNAASMSCKMPEAPATMDFVATGKAHLDLITMAFACDITRVGSIQWRSSDTSFTWVGVNGGHHNISHQQGGAAADASLIKIMTWFSGQVAYILERLKSFEEPGGSVLDSTLLFWVNELATGNHKLVRNPYLLAAGKLPLDGGGTLQTGRFLKYPNGTPHTGLLTVIGQIMGLKINSFGNPEWNKGPLPGVI